MSTITIEVPDEVAEELRGAQDRLGEIVVLGLREWRAQSQIGFDGAAEVLEFLAKLPPPNDIISLQPSPRLAQRVSELLEKNRTVGLTEKESVEWERFEYLEHLVRMAKAAAHAALNSTVDG